MLTGEDVKTVLIVKMVWHKHTMGAQSKNRKGEEKERLSGEWGRTDRGSLKTKRVWLGTK